MKPTPYQKLAPMEPPFQLPEISDKLLTDRYFHIRPLVEHPGNGELYYIEHPKSLRGVAYPWDPELTEKAEDLEPITTIRTLHTWAYYGFFKPTVAEVIAAIPEEHLGEAVAWHLQGPEDVNDLNVEKEAVDAGFHVAYCTLYRKSPCP
jgi:hypothetical protein